MKRNPRLSWDSFSQPLGRSCMRSFLPRIPKMCHMVSWHVTHTLTNRCVLIIPRWWEMGRCLHGRTREKWENIQRMEGARTIWPYISSSWSHGINHEPFFRDEAIKCVPGTRCKARKYLLSHTSTSPTTLCLKKKKGCSKNTLFKIRCRWSQSFQAVPPWDAIWLVLLKTRWPPVRLVSTDVTSACTEKYCWNPGQEVSCWFSPISHGASFWPIFVITSRRKHGKLVGDKERTTRPPWRISTTRKIINIHTAP